MSNELTDFCMHCGFMIVERTFKDPAYRDEQTFWMIDMLHHPDYRRITDRKCCEINNEFHYPPVDI